MGNCIREGKDPVKGLGVTADTGQILNCLHEPAAKQGNLASRWARTVFCTRQRGEEGPYLKNSESIGNLHFSKENTTRTAKESKNTS